MQRVVLDTNVLLSAMLTSLGPAGVMVGMIIGRRLQLVLDERIMDEYDEVLSRPKFGIERCNIVGVLDRLRRVGHFHAGVPLPKGSKGLPDPKDAMFLEVALGGKAEAIITRNIKHFPPSHCCGIQVVTPEDLMGRIGF